MDIDRFFYGAAPELADHERFGLTDTGVTKASDVYAFGVLAWEVSMMLWHVPNNSLNRTLHRQTFTGQVPFPDKNKVAAVVSMWKGHRPARPDHPEVSNRLWKAIQGCWKVDPGRRMTIAEVAVVLEEGATADQSR